MDKLRRTLSFSSSSRSKFDHTREKTLEMQQLLDRQIKKNQKMKSLDKQSQERLKSLAIESHKEKQEINDNYVSTAELTKKEIKKLGYNADNFDKLIKKRVDTLKKDEQELNEYEDKCKKFDSLHRNCRNFWHKSQAKGEELKSNCERSALIVKDHCEKLSEKGGKILRAIDYHKSTDNRSSSFLSKDPLSKDKENLFKKFKEIHKFQKDSIEELNQNWNLTLTEDKRQTLLDHRTSLDMAIKKFEKHEVAINLDESLPPLISALKEYRGLLNEEYLQALKKASNCYLELSDHLKKEEKIQSDLKSIKNSIASLKEESEIQEDKAKKVESHLNTIQLNLNILKGITAVPQAESSQPEIPVPPVHPLWKNLNLNEVNRTDIERITRSLASNRKAIKSDKTSEKSVLSWDLGDHAHQRRKAPERPFEKVNSTVLGSGYEEKDNLSELKSLLKKPTDSLEPKEKQSRPIGFTDPEKKKSLDKQSQERLKSLAMESRKGKREIDDKYVSTAERTKKEIKKLGYNADNLDELIKKRKEILKFEKQELEKRKDERQKFDDLYKRWRDFWHGNQAVEEELKSNCERSALIVQDHCEKLSEKGGKILRAIDYHKSTDNGSSGFFSKDPLSKDKGNLFKKFKEIHKFQKDSIEELNKHWNLTDYERQTLLDHMTSLDTAIKKFEDHGATINLDKSLLALSSALKEYRGLFNEEYLQALKKASNCYLELSDHLKKEEGIQSKLNSVKEHRKSLKEEEELQEDKVKNAESHLNTIQLNLNILKGITAVPQAESSQPEIPAPPVNPLWKNLNLNEVNRTDIKRITLPLANKRKVIKSSSTNEKSALSRDLDALEREKAPERPFEKVNPTVLDSGHEEKDNLSELKSLLKTPPDLPEPKEKQSRLVGFTDPETNTFQTASDNPHSTTKASDTPAPMTKARLNVLQRGLIGAWDLLLNASGHSEGTYRD